MNIRRGFMRLYLVVAVLAFGWLNKNVFKQHDDAIIQGQGEYRVCVDSTMLRAFGAIPGASPPLYWDSNGVAIYDAKLYPDFAAWQVRVGEDAEARARVLKTRPAVEHLCAGVQKSRELRARWIEVGAIGLKILGLAGLYWFLIWIALIARWVYRGFFTDRAATS
jgi:hypothetical protein